MSIIKIRLNKEEEKLENEFDMKLINKYEENLRNGDVEFYNHHEV